MFLITHSLPFTEDKYETPTFLIKKENNYAPILRLTNDVDYPQQIDFAIQDLLSLLYSILSSMEEVERRVQESITQQLVFLRENYPLKYTSYTKSCTTINNLLFSNDEVEFVDAQLSIVYNELLNSERLTLAAQAYIENLNIPLNEKINTANEKINFLNTYGNANLPTLPLLTNYREQNYITLITDRINDINTFSNFYYAN